VKKEKEEITFVNKTAKGDFKGMRGHPPPPHPHPHPLPLGSCARNVLRACLADEIIQNVDLIMYGVCLVPGSNMVMRMTVFM
jgi:hypothetical protein